MKTTIFFCVLACLGLTACASNPSRTHRGDVLDDKVTAQRVQSELTQAGSDFRDVHVTATNGVVTLSGSVKSSEVRSRAEDLTHQVHRVTGIDDNLQVRQ